MRVRGNGWLLVGTALMAWTVAACGSTQPQSSGASPSATASATATATEAPLSGAELKTLALTEDDVPGNLGVSAGVRAPGEPDSTFPPVSDTACQEMLDVLGAKSSSAVVDQIFNWKGSIWPGGGILASYEDTGAEDAFDRLRTSLTSCSDYTGVGYTGKFSAHVATEKLPPIGDESIAFRITVPVKQAAGLRSGRRISVRNEQHILVRVGHVTAYFSMLDVDHSAHFPLALMRKEIDRLTEAQRT